MKRHYRTEPLRCTCASGSDAHPMHAKPGNVVGKHWDPNCPHSELYNCLVRFPAMREAQQRKRQFTQPMPRHRVE